MRTGIHKIILAFGIGIVACGEADANNQSEQKRSHDLYVEGCRFSEKDFPKENSSEKLFYVAEGEDDGLQEVRPNLKRMPERLKNALSMFHGYRPPAEGVDNRGEIYVCDSSADTIKHVGDGWVVAQSRFERKFVGFIYTDETDMYIEGQNLKRGYYVLVGRQKVQLVNGSSLSMYAFAKLGKESNCLVMEAVKYNKEAEAAAAKENMRRTEKRKEIEKGKIRLKLHEELAKLFTGFSFREVKSQFHFPEDLAGLIGDIELVKPGICGFDRFEDFEREEDFINAIKTNNWDYITKRLNDKEIPRSIYCDFEKHPIEWAEELFERAHLFVREVKIENLGEITAKYEFYSVNRHGRHRNEIRKEYASGTMMQVPIGADIYFVRKKDVQFFSPFFSSSNKGVDDFIAAYKEREEYNRKLNVYHKELEKLFSDFVVRDVQAQCHLPVVSTQGDCGGVKVKQYDSYWGKIINPTLQKKNWRYLEHILEIQSTTDADPVRRARDVFMRLYAKERKIELKWIRKDSGKNSVRGGRRRGKAAMVEEQRTEPVVERPEPELGFFVVDKIAEVPVEFVGLKRRPQPLEFKVKIGADLFCVQNEDKEVFSSIRDAKTFAETWDKKYGATANK